MTAIEKIAEQEKFERFHRLREIRVSAKALYLIDGIHHMMLFLDACVETGMITEAEADYTAKFITEQCTKVTVGVEEQIRRLIRETGKE